MSTGSMQIERELDAISAIENFPFSENKEFIF